MKKYGNAIKYTAFCLAAVLVALGAAWAVKGDIFGFVSKDAPAREEFEYETEDKRGRFCNPTKRIRKIHFRSSRFGRRNCGYLYPR